MRYGPLLPMSAVSVRQSVCHAGSFGAAFAKSLWPLVVFAANELKSRYISLLVYTEI